ncbi:two-component system, OmpR family, sensor kinase [Persephonella hydrogeniphila]|uniref:histidine kinase n=1 Tax=Persephonella hydrogeniphila TaxID=198703 RepID=A0A285NPN2_9AQUI|nr:HAMP domain-containing sensor histidine kinase [Persephonella hydrogeniphila]SNZ09591.1 two-component system, OmpR family, sensor kinase [Persephonella hydrogeniphila]
MRILNSLWRNRYEKESFIKSFLLFFLSIFLLISVVFLFYAQNLKQEKLYSLFLEMKNYSLSLKGKKFETELVSGKKSRVYELLEDGKYYYIDVPIPFVKDEFLRIQYPKQKFLSDFYSSLKPAFYFYLLSVFFTLIFSFGFSIYSLSPLRKAYRLLDEAIKDIIHDINTPVTTILINGKILSMKYKDDEDVKSIVLAIKQLSSIYNNLRYLLKETEKNLQDVNLKNIVQSEINFLKKIHPDIKVNTKLKDKIVKADRTVAERIILNLLSNAFKHNIKNGYVYIEINDKLVIKNSSPEIKNINRLFDRYYRESDRGVGIGLTIVKKLCSEMGWDLNITYRKGEFTAEITF